MLRAETDTSDGEKDSAASNLAISERPNKVYRMASPWRESPYFTKFLTITEPHKMVISKMHQALKDRTLQNQSGPCKSWEPSVGYAIKMLKATLSAFKSNITLSQMIATGYIAN